MILLMNTIVHVKVAGPEILVVKVFIDDIFFVSQQVTILTQNDVLADIDECLSSPCINGGNCEDHLNYYLCHCQAGYNGTICQENIDECVSDPCLHGGTCQDEINGYICVCNNTGFNGINCELSKTTLDCVLL